jgi:BirA family transcriptional regulator, biotin operon repressor / biotin---[acetyl-CoA-carboxylase] ligase
MNAQTLASLARAELRRRGRAELRFEWLEAVDSTNSALLRAGPPPATGSALLAELQSAGRWRLGRAWQSMPGASLCLSVALPLSGGWASASGLSLAAGVAVAELLRARGARQVGLKWPNDIYAQERKLGGLLVELGGRDAAAFAVIGLGLNLALPPSFEAGQPATDLAAQGLDCSTPLARAQLAAALIDGLVGAGELFAREGLIAFRARHAALDLFRGRRVRVLAGGQEHLGVLAGIDERGALRLLQVEDGGERVFASAEVSLRTA